MIFFALEGDVLSSQAVTISALVFEADLSSSSVFCTDILEKLVQENEKSVPLLMRQAEKRDSRRTVSQHKFYTRIIVI